MEWLSFCELNFGYTISGDFKKLRNFLDHCDPPGG